MDRLDFFGAEEATRAVVTVGGTDVAEAEGGDETGVSVGSRGDNGGVLLGALIDTFNRCTVGADGGKAQSGGDEAELDNNGRDEGVCGGDTSRQFDEVSGDEVAGERREAEL